MKMQETHRAFFLLLMAVLLTVAACASQQPPLTIVPAKGEAVVAVKAFSFKFEPDTVRAHKGDVLIFQVENMSSTVHTFTVKDPAGLIIRSVFLSAGQTTSAKVDISATGIYEFYCDRPLHSSLGMKGRIVVDQEP